MLSKLKILQKNEKYYKFATEIKNELNNKINAKITSIFENKKFKKMMEYANKLNSKFTIIIGEDEVANNTVSVKNMITGEQLNLTLSEVVNMFNKEFNK